MCGSLFLIIFVNDLEVLLVSKPVRSIYPLILAIAGAVILVIALISLTVLSKSALPRGTATVPPGVQVIGSFPEIPRVSLADAKAAFDKGSAVFVDARSTDAYALSHIPGALSIPDNVLSSRMSELNPKDWIITYCT
jgi:hypothetical protein